MLTQMSICNGKPLFSVEYKDSYLDDYFWFEVEEAEEEDNDHKSDDDSL